MPRWLLPENISDVLPLEARRVEELRRALLDLYRGYGYELVIPPLIEYLDSLLTGTGSDLDLRMFKLTDQASGRMLGLRADATPQVARIDAHILNRPGVARLCYAGSVLHARPLHPLASRE
ncbi:MAG: ATP phosphoribosyltransferase regulatory subunit, partial [Burkholderiaceae bacterium]